MNVNVMIVIAVSLFVAGMGVLGLVSPAAMARFVSGLQSRGALVAAAAIRFVFGVALWQAAAASRSPAVFKVLGVLAVISALGLPLIGVARFKAVLHWWSTRLPAVVRLWSGAAALTGAFILWSVAAV